MIGVHRPCRFEILCWFELVWAGLDWCWQGRQERQRTQGRLYPLMPFVVHRPCRFEMLGWFGLVFAWEAGAAKEAGEAKYTHAVRRSSSMSF